MSDPEQPRKDIILHTDMIGCTPDGDALLAGHYHSDASPEEIKEHIVETRGADPETVFVGQPQQQRRKGFVGYMGSRWNSPWDPRGGDPNNN